MTSDNNIEKELSFKDIVIYIKIWFNFILSKWKTVFFAAIVGAALGMVYSYLKKPVYTATTSFVLENDKKSSGGLGSLAGLASIAGFDLGGDGGGIFEGDNILELYKSRTMLEKALLTKVAIESDSILLIDRYIDQNKLRKGWKDDVELENIKFQSIQLNLKHSRLQDSIIGDIAEKIKKNNLSASKPDKKLSIISVSISSKDEQFAKYFNETIVRNVNEFYVETKTKKATLNLSLLQHKTDSVTSGMRRAIYSAASISDATPNLNPVRQRNRIAPVQSQQMTIETNKAVLSELIKNLEMAKLSLQKETPLIQVLDQPVFPLNRKYISRLNGTVYGATFAVFITVILLSVRRSYYSIMN